MNRLTKLLVLSALLVLIVVSATEAVAGPPGSAWWRFTNAAGGDAKLAFQVTATRNVTVTAGTYAGSGAQLSNMLAQGLCLADGCDSPPGSCVSTFPANSTNNHSKTCGTTDPYTISTNQVDGILPDFPNSLHIDPVGDTEIRKAQVRWDRPFASDLLETYTVRLAPNGINGIATFEVEDANEAVLGSFTVNTTGQTDLQIHTAIRNGYLSLGLGLGAIVCDQSTLATESVDPNGFPGFGVRVTYPSNVSGFDVLSLPGQTVTQEMTGAGPVSDVPTMSEWGMAILVALLLITGIWMMRRRQRLQSA